MRYLFLSIESELSDLCLKDLKTPYFNDVLFIDYNQISKPHDVQFDNITQYLASFQQCGSINLSLPENPIVVILYNYSDQTHYKVKVNHISQKSEMILKNDFQLFVYHDYVEPIITNAKQPAKKTEVVPISYQINEQELVCPLLITITQQLVQDFMLRQLYLKNIKDSSVINLSGKSLFSQVYPDFYVTINDQYTQKMYDVDMQLNQMNSCYSALIDSIPFIEQNSLSVILGCAIDAVQTVTEKHQSQPDETLQGIILPASELSISETIQLDYSLPNIRAHQFLSRPITDFSIFDTFEHTIYCKLTTTQARYYTKMAFDAYLKYYKLVNQLDSQKTPNKDPNRQTPRTVMLRRADFAELIGMFMKDCGGEKLGLIEAESVIRKTLLMHLQNIDSGDYYVNLTDPISDEISSDISVIKLGARKNSEYNELPVHAQLSISEDIPCSLHQHFDAMGNNLCFVQDPILPQNEDLGIVKTNVNNMEMQFYISNQVEKIAKDLNIEYNREKFVNGAPNIDEFFQLIQDVSLLVSKDVQIDPKKKSETIQELGFSHQLITNEIKQDFIVALQPMNEKDKKNAGQRKIFGCPFLCSYKGQIFVFLQLLLHSWYSQSLSLLQQGLPQNVEKLSIDCEDAPSVERDTNENEVVQEVQKIQVFQNINEQFKQEDSSIYQLFGLISSISFKNISQIDMQPPPSKDKKPKAGEQITPKIQIELFDQAYPLVVQALFLALNIGDEKAFYAIEKCLESIELQYSPLFFIKKSSNTNFLTKQTQKHVTFDFILQLQQGQLKIQNARQLTIEKIANQKLFCPYRNYQNFSIPVGDRSIINSFPINNKIQLVRKWNSLQQSIVNYSGPQQFTDKFTFSAAQLQRQVLIENESVTFTSEVPTVGKLHGELQDESNLRCFNESMVFEKNGISQKFSLLDDMELFKVFDSFNSNIPIICKMVNNQPKYIKCIFKNDGQFICLQDGQQLFAISDVFEEELIENAVLHPKLVFSKSQSRTSYLDQITGMIFEQFGFLQSIRRSLLDQDGEMKVIQTFQIPYLLSISQVIFKEDSIKDSFLKLDTKCTIIELPVLERIVFMFNISKTVISVSFAGDVFIQIDGVTYALKQDASFFILLSVSTCGGNFYKTLNEIQTAGIPVDTKASKKPKASGDVSVLGVQDDAKEESKIFQSPLILYGGQGFHFWHSILKRRTKFLNNVDLTTRISFEKQAPIMKNPELNNKYENLEPINLLFDIVKLCQTEYTDLVHNSTSLFKVLQKAQLNFNRIHHEMFLPISNTYQSHLTGIYRFVLGTSDAPQDSPLYPSVSSIDWVGNTFHLRLGSSYESTFNLKSGTSRSNTPKSRPISSSAIKQRSKDPAIIDQQNYQQDIIFAQDNCHPVFPPLLTETIQTDITGELVNLIKKRELEAINQAKEKILQQEQAARSPTPDDKKSKKPTKPSKKDEPKSPEPVLEKTPQLRPLTQILNELEQIEIDTIQNSFKKFILFMSGSTEHVLLGKRALDYSYESDILEQFIQSAIPNSQIPSPAQQIMHKRYIIIPQSPDQKYFKGTQSFDFSDQAFCTIDNDVPWIVVDNKEINQLTYFANMLEFANVTNFSLLVHSYFSRISTNFDFSKICGLGFQPGIKSSLLEQLNEVRVILSKLTLNNQNQASQQVTLYSQFLPYFDPTYMFSNIQNPEYFLQIYHFASNSDPEYWKNLEKTKQKWREITNTRTNLLKNNNNIQNKQKISEHLISEISDIIQAKKEQLKRENERILQQKKLEMEKIQQQEREKIIEEMEIQNQIEQQPEFDYMIDKPMKNDKKHKNKAPNKHMQLSAISPRTSLGTDEDSEDEESQYTFGQATLVSQRGSRNSYLLAAKKMATGARILPKIGLGKVSGALIGVLKIMPQSINSRCQENHVILKNLQQEAVKVFLQFQKEDIDIQNSEILIQPFQSVCVVVRHKCISESVIKLKTITQIDDQVVEDVQVVEVRGRVK
ncbi:hypothetical protein SS50377_23061 [Spironucleus salmonicida]|uniref:Uncharacterized protein n=1 Tax=Spironucleus salmonicida TaxID=348837 RepID=V6LSJ0_9EUKA|nr:hypothetical protein SS50377_23061 [Spironucleus salmonicida]|eukprot:EST47637.1 hypothetical protein SS50377_12332 [Spironucleus salmonicida]